MLSFLQLLSTLFFLQLTAAGPPGHRGGRHGPPRRHKPSDTSTTSNSSSGAPSHPVPFESKGKRGLSYNDATLTAPFSLAGQSPNVTWAYNYYSFPYTIGQNQSGYNKALDFVPMLWSTAPDLTSVWQSNVNASIAKYNTTAVVAFNEPDLCGDGGSCMNLTAAVTGYQKWMNPLAGTVKLGSPAVTNGEGYMGLTYLKNFLNQCTGCHIDFVPIHWYGDAGNSTAFEQHLWKAQRVAEGRPLWVTEFGTTSGTAEQTKSFLKNTMRFMDESPIVERYAYFMNKVGILINANGTGLSDLGHLYNGE